MAFDLKKSSGALDFTERSKEERALELKNRRIVENDKVTRESIRQAIDHHKEVMHAGTQEERINHYSAMHIQREVGGLLIGDGLIEEQRRIDGGESQYSSFNEMFEANKDILPFGKSTGYQYMQIAKAIPVEYFEKMTVRKALAVAQIRDDKKREIVIKKVVAERMNDTETKEFVDSFFEREKDKMRKVRDEKRETVEDLMADMDITVTLNGTKRIIMDFSTQHARDVFNNFIFDTKATKRRIAEKILEEKYPSRK